MKKKWVVVLAVLLLCAAGGGAVWAAGSGSYKRIEVYFEKIQLGINNQYIYLSKEGIIYEGTVYVPLRELGTRLGASVNWNPELQAVEYTFSPNRWTALNIAARKGLYQYIIMENDSIMRLMTEGLRTDNPDALKEAAARFDQLVKYATDLDARDQNNDLADVVQWLTKLRSAAGLLHTGWAARNPADYFLAMDIIESNEQLLLTRLQNIIDNLGL